MLNEDGRLMKIKVDENLGKKEKLKTLIRNTSKKEYMSK